MLTPVVPSARMSAQGSAVTITHPSGPRGYTDADVDFMQGMIVHHAQAVVMSDWAPTHDAGPRLLTLTKRIALSQRDEITQMQHWLLDRRLAAPDPLHMLSGHGASTALGGQDAHHAVVDRSGMHMPGMDMGSHPMMMSGMLSPPEMRQLDSARGATFDRLYLTGMIKHHQGALDMVATLFDTPGAGQQPEIFTFATDVDAEQRAQMTRMYALLDTLNPNPAR